MARRKPMDVLAHAVAAPNDVIATFPAATSAYVEAMQGLGRIVVVAPDGSLASVPRTV